MVNFNRDPHGEDYEGADIILDWDQIDDIGRRGTEFQQSFVEENNLSGKTLAKAIIDGEMCHARCHLGCLKRVTQQRE